LIKKNWFYVRDKESDIEIKIGSVSKIFRESIAYRILYARKYYVHHCVFLIANDKRLTIADIV